MSKEINVLILSAGRRVELVQCFKNAAKKLKVSSKIVAADLSDTAPAIYFADKYYLISRIGSKDYVQKILDICKKEKINLIVPTIDTELQVLSEKKKYIEENTFAKVLISDKEVIKICRNKKNTQNFFEKNGFGVPKEYTEQEIKQGDICYPVFIKPLDGSSSINAFKVNNQKELEFFYEYIDNPIVQEYMEGEEYTIDVFLDFDGNILSIVPRLRIATRGGEILKGKIVQDVDIINDVKRLIKKLKPIGHITVQCMKTSEGIKYIEINPRFGGGAPMSIMYGEDSCEKLYRLLNGESMEYSQKCLEETIFLRFDSGIALNQEMEILYDKSSYFRFR